MKLMQLNQRGVGHIAALLVVVFVAVAGFAGYKVVTMNKTSQPVAATTVAASPKVPAKITNKTDLTDASMALDSQSAQVNGSLNDNALNTDLNDML